MAYRNCTHMWGSYVQNMGHAPQTSQTWRCLQVLPAATAAPEPSLVSPKHRKNMLQKISVWSTEITSLNKSKSEKECCKLCIICCERLLKAPDSSDAEVIISRSVLSLVLFIFIWYKTKCTTLYYLGRKEPEEKVTVVGLVHSEISWVTFDIGTRKGSHQTQFFGCTFTIHKWKPISI